MAKRKCPYCGDRFARLDRHLSGRTGCSELHQRARAAAAAAEVDEDQGDGQPPANVARRDAAGDFVDLEGQRRIRAFDPAVSGGEPHRMGVDPTPVHPDDPEPGAGRHLRRRPKQGGNP